MTCWRSSARRGRRTAGADETITRIVGGIETPFEAYLQLHLQITPMLNDNVRGLLERLFPRLEVFTWIW